MALLSNFARRAALAFARSVGSKITDAETGKVLGRAFLFPWRGKIVVIGLEAEVKPVFLGQKRLTWWKQDLGFTVQPPPDFPHETGAQRPPNPPAE